jgi:putative flavoprotein involved in K+ transport
VSSEPGVYFLGLPWLSRRGSSFIWGVWHDAKYLADHITTQRGYLTYGTSREPRSTAAAEEADSDRLSRARQNQAIRPLVMRR